MHVLLVTNYNLMTGRQNLRKAREQCSNLNFKAVSENRYLGRCLGDQKGGSPVYRTRLSPGSIVLTDWRRCWPPSHRNVMHYSNYHSNRSIILCNAPLGEEGGKGYEYAALEAAIKGEFLSSLFGDTDNPQSCRILCPPCHICFCS